MKRKDLNVSFPVHDYRPALQGALSWLGDRYLLAEPTPRLQEHAPAYSESRKWHPAVVSGALAKTRR